MKQPVANIQLSLLIGALDATEAVHYANYHSAVPRGRGWEIEKIVVTQSIETQPLQKLLNDSDYEGIRGENMYLVQFTMTKYVELPDESTNNRGDNREVGVAPTSQGSREGDSNPEFGSAPTEA